jgi:hypothetical protein
VCAFPAREDPRLLKTLIRQRGTCYPTPATPGTPLITIGNPLHDTLVIASLLIAVAHLPSAATSNKYRRPKGLWPMSNSPFAGMSRREFLAKVAAAGGTAMLASWASPIIGVNGFR